MLCKAAVSGRFGGAVFCSFFFVQAGKGFRQQLGQKLCLLFFRQAFQDFVDARRLFRERAGG